MEPQRRAPMEAHTKLGSVCWGFKTEFLYAHLSPATPRTTRLSLVKVPVLSKQHTSTLPAKGIRKGSVQYMSRGGGVTWGQGVHPGSCLSYAMPHQSLSTHRAWPGR